MPLLHGEPPVVGATSHSTAVGNSRVWEIVAPHVQSADLYSACLVSQLWHRIFVSFLWGNPGSRFGTASDDICTSLTKFKRGLKRARYEVRSLTHTLNIPPATPELCDGPQSGWLRDCLDCLPFLQSLVVSGVAFFDHESLRTVRRSHTGGWERRKSNEAVEPPVHYGLRLLTAASCPNTTATSLASALTHFPHLMYLDLSSTIGVRSPQVLRQITCLEQLQILKLQNCGLRDYDIQFLTFNDSNLLRSLDLRNNLLTEAGIATILNGLTLALQFVAEAHREPWHISKADNFERLVQDHLTTGFAHRAFIEEQSPAGLSHLYVAGNDLSIEGLAAVLVDQQLRILDCGSLTAWQTTNGLRSPSLPNRLQFHPLPSVLSLSQFTQAFQTLTYLRIHHSFVTEHTFSCDTLFPSEKYAELDGAVPSYEIDSTEVDYVVPEARHGTVELADTSALVELPGDLAPQFELHGESVKSSPTRSTSDIEPTAPLRISRKYNTTLKAIKPLLHTVDTSALFSSSNNAVSPSTPRENLRASSFGPSSLARRDSGLDSPSTLQKLSHIGPTSHPHDTSYVVSPLSPHENFISDSPLWSTGPETDDTESHPASKPLEPTNEELIEEIASRRRGIRARERKSNVLLPSMLPNLRTLILTDVPSKTRSNRVATALIHFIRECGEEESLAALESTRLHPEIALLERHDGHAIKKPPRQSFLLQKLVLEMSSSPVPDTPPLSPRIRSSSTSTHRNSLHRDSFTKSSTGDADSETFMSATEMDFSFFGDDDCSLLVTEGRIDAPCGSFPTNEKMLVPGSGMGVHPGFHGQDAPAVDVISELSKFRKRTRGAWEASAGDGSCRVERALLGNWSGDIAVVRQQSHM